MSVKTQGRARPPRRRRNRAAITTATGLIAAAALAAPAHADITEPPTNGHSIISFPERDFVSAEGYDQNDRPIVKVIRNGATIATSTAVEPVDDPSTPTFDGVVEVNHPGGGCWENSTPDILPGDKIQIETAPGVGDATTTANVKAEPARLEGGNVVVRGTAFNLDGTPMPLDQVEQRIIAGSPGFSNGRRRLQATTAGPPADDAQLHADPVAGPGHWIVTYSAITADDKTLAVDSETRVLWLGGDPLAGNELTIFEVGPGDAIVGGPSAPCTAPFAQTAIGGISRTLINNATAGEPITVSGPAAADITAVTVSLNGADVPGAATLAGSTWSKTIDGATISALPDGPVTLKATFAGPTAPPAETRTLTKDTVAPPAPTATPGAGTFASAQAVTLSDAEAGVAMRYTNDGSTPSASSLLFTGPIPVTASQTINAIAIDAAGNSSAVSTFNYVIQPGGGVPPAGGGGGVPPAGGAGGGAATPPAQVIPGPTQTVAVQQPGNNQTVAPRLGLQDLLPVGRLTRAKLRANGLRLRMQLEDGTRVVRISIFRAKRNGQRTGRQVFTTVRGVKATTKRITLRNRAVRRLKAGRYVARIQPGRNRADRSGVSSSVAFRVG